MSELHVYDRDDSDIEPQCAGLEGCRELEGVMYDLFVHDPKCSKGTASAPDAQSGEQRAPELLPCPFCGGKPAWGEGEQKTKYGNEQVYCSVCYAMTPPEMTMKEAARDWNTRINHAEKYPWQTGVLADWSIVGMNHYHVNGERRLFVAMTKDCHCITAEGHDEEQVFEALHTAAFLETDYPVAEKCRGNETGYHTCGLPIGGCGSRRKQNVNSTEPEL